jgi:dolichol-phosphate mannosyltransferase
MVQTIISLSDNADLNTAPNPSTDDAPDFSVVLPVYNEESNLETLHRRLSETFQKMGRSYELVFVDDGSSDGSYSKLRQLFERDPAVRIIKFSRNFGHHIAVTAGLDYVRGEFVVLMDSDLQDQPEEIPALYAKIEEGYDVVYGIRKNKKFSVTKRASSAAFRWVMRHILRYEITGGIFRILRRQVVQEVRRCRETDRLVIGLINWTGFRQTGVEVEHGARLAGVTKYSLRKQLQLATNAITAFSTLPLKFASWLGFAISAMSFIAIVLIFLRKLFWGLGEIGWPSLMVTITFLGGVQLLCLGILGEYIGRIFNETRKRPLYVVENALEQPNKRSDSL